jgi:hypothetical protein
MMSDLKYYIANIDERHGEFECSISILIETKYKDVDERHEEIVKDWYGIELNEDPDNEGVYWNDCMTYTAGDIMEISKSTFNQLSRKNKKRIGISFFSTFRDGD